MVTRVAVASTMAILVACSSTPSLDEYPCPEAGTTLTYENFGRPFMDAWCNECHSEPEGARQGAPADVRFDNLAGVRRWDDRIFARSALDRVSMPPGLGDPPRADRDRLAEWLACGAPE